MDIVESLESIPKLSPPIAFLIGNFDGVHLGHKHLIEKARELSQGQVAILTFSNHPTDFFKGDKPMPRLATPEEKMERLESLGVNLVINLKFDESIAQMSYDAFLKKVQAALPFTHLVRGKGSCFGKGRKGTEENVMELSKSMEFQAHYINILEIDGKSVTSSRIRTLIAEGLTEEAHKLLGH